MKRIIHKVSLKYMELEEQHPIPQQISAYQFRLVGDMTIKQFFQVAGGALVALLIYSSNAPNFIKWPLIIASFLTGIAFAFLPLQDRPLSTWILLFFKSIYSPTFYIWKKGVKKEYFFLPEPETNPTTPKATQQVPTLPELRRLEEKESSFLSNMSQHLITTQPKEEITPQTPTNEKPPVGIPNKQAVTLEQKPKETITTQKTTPQKDSFIPSTITPVSTHEIKEGKFAQFSTEAAPPSPPTKPNVVVGQVIDPNGGIIEAAILEIRDNEGRPVRALKSNKLGHFMIVTPLLNGKYQIVTEKEGYEFEPVTIEAMGEIIPPIAIRPKKTTRKID